MFGLFGSSESSTHFDIKRRGDVTVVHVHGPEYRHPEGASVLGEDLWKLVDKEGHRALVVDLSKVAYLGSTAFAVLLNLARKIEAIGGKLKLYGLQHDVEIGSRIIGMSRIIPTFPDEAAALASD